MVSPELSAGYLRGQVREVLLKLWRLKVIPVPCRCWRCRRSYRVRILNSSTDWTHARPRARTQAGANGLIWSRRRRQPSGRFLSRRDYRTQPGVLTPGTRPKKCPALKGQQIVVIDGSFGQVLHICGTGSTAPVGAARFSYRHLGLKPQAQS
jgi:hypothetical protein